MQGIENAMFYLKFNYDESHEQFSAISELNGDNCAHGDKHYAEMQAKIFEAIRKVDKTQYDSWSSIAVKYQKFANDRFISEIMQEPEQDPTYRTRAIISMLGEQFALMVYMHVNAGAFLSVYEDLISDNNCFAYIQLILVNKLIRDLICDMQAAKSRLVTLLTELLYSDVDKVNNLTDNQMDFYDIKKPNPLPDMWYLEKNNMKSPFWREPTKKNFSWLYAKSGIRKSSEPILNKIFIYIDKIINFEAKTKEIKSARHRIQHRYIDPSPVFYAVDSESRESIYKSEGKVIGKGVPMNTNPYQAGSNALNEHGELINKNLGELFELADGVLALVEPGEKLLLNRVCT